MGQLLKGETFSNGEQVTALRLNQLVDSATLTTGAITEQANLSPNTLAADDSLLAYDFSANALREITASDILNSGITVTTSSITGKAGSDLSFTAASGHKFSFTGDFSATGAFTLTGKINGTGAVEIASGSTAQRPATPSAGSIRFNTETVNLEFYTGAAWINSSIVGNTNTFTSTNTFSGTANINGTLKVNSKVGFVLYDIHEEAGVTVSAIQHTKPVGEMWIVEIQTNIGASGSWHLKFPTYSAASEDVTGTGQNWLTFRKVYGANTTFIAQTFGLWGWTGVVVTYASSYFRIYKYKTADDNMVKSKSYTNNGTSVTVTSVAHGLTVGQLINVFADKSVIGGLVSINTVTTDQFTYSNTTAAGSGTLCYVI